MFALISLPGTNGEKPTHLPILGGLTRKLRGPTKTMGTNHLLNGMILQVVPCHFMGFLFEHFFRNPLVFKDMTL